MVDELAPLGTLVTYGTGHPSLDVMVLDEASAFLLVVDILRLSLLCGLAVEFIQRFLSDRNLFQLSSIHLYRRQILISVRNRRPHIWSRCRVVDIDVYLAASSAIISLVLCIFGVNNLRLLGRRCSFL
jgi:hypothetical protein